MYLLDTNVVSEMRRLKPHGGVIAWLRDVRDVDLNLAAVTLGELQSGVEITRLQDEAKAAEIERWVDKLAATHNVIPVDGSIYRLWARLMHRRTEHLSEDAMIAATALIHDLIVVTRNVRDFAPFKVRLFNPFTR